MVAETARKPGAGEIAVLNRAVRMGLTKKVTCEQRPKEARRARTPCGHLGEEMPGRRSRDSRRR